MEINHIINEQNSILLSVIIPAYNVEEYIHECINSILVPQKKQDFQFGTLQGNIEIILVDDGSTDGTGEVCEQYAKEYNNIRVIHQKNSGVSVARNNGLKNAYGKWICFVDSDDQVDFDVIMDMLSWPVLESYEIVAYSVEIERPNGKTTVSSNSGMCFFYNMCDLREKFQKLCMQNQLYWPDVVEESHKYPIMTYCVNKLIKRSFLLQNNIMMMANVAQLEDKIFNFECVSCASRVMFYDKVAYHYRYNPTSAVHSDGIKMITQIRESIQCFSKVIETRRSELLDQAFSYCCAQALWTIVDRLGVRSDSLAELPSKAKYLKEFIKEPAIKETLKKTKLIKINSMKHRIICGFLKYDITLLPIGICFIYHKVHKLRESVDNGNN